MPTLQKTWLTLLALALLFCSVAGCDTGPTSDPSSKAGTPGYAIGTAWLKQLAKQAPPAHFSADPPLSGTFKVEAVEPSINFYPRSQNVVQQAIEAETLLGSTASITPDGEDPAAFTITLTLGGAANTFTGALYQEQNGRHGVLFFGPCADFGVDAQEVDSFAYGKGQMEEAGVELQLFIGISAGPESAGGKNGKSHATLRWNVTLTPSTASTD